MSLIVTLQSPNLCRFLLFSCLLFPLWFLLPVAILVSEDFLFFLSVANQTALLHSARLYGGMEINSNSH